MGTINFTTKTLKYMGLPTVKADTELTDMQRIVLILLGSGVQTYFEGSKNKKTKRRQMTDAGNQLKYVGLAKFSVRGNGYEGSLTDEGLALYETMDSADIAAVTRQSAAQQERQAERENGKYSEMNTCDYCGKRGGNMYADESTGGIICARCSAEGKNQEEE